MKNLYHYNTLSFLRKTLALFCCLTILFLSNGCTTNSKTEKQETKKEAQKPTVIKEKWHWDNPKKQSENAGYAQVVKVGNTLYVSGIPAQEISPEGITKLYDAIKRCLNAFGASPKDIVKETLYTTDIEAMKKNNDARKQFYKGDYPAASWVEISRLYQPGAKIEVDVIAEITDTTK
ncbi:RidA family protein [Tenacibaculum amylolyticum]|uniref:RidA family protein n=1 Tax=Tenacibaculum amylolyticum TaxID=104269 RepID=UPI0038931F0C